MAMLFNKEDTYKVNLELNKDEILKDLKEIRAEVKATTKEINFDIKKLRLRRKDILVVKVHAFFKADDMKVMKKELKKQIHRRVLLINDSVDISHVISYQKR